MLNARRALLLTIGSCLFLFSNCDRPLKKYYRINSRWTKECIHLTPADMNGDGVDEFVQIKEGQLDVVDQSLRNYHRSIGMTEYPSFKVAPIPGASLDSVSFLIFSETRDTACVDLFSHVKRNAGEQRITFPVYRFPRPHRLNGDHYEQNIAYLGRRDSASDSPSLFRLSTGRSLNNKRGLILLDLSKHRELWRFTCGPQVRSPMFTNIDADSSAELIFGSYASDNGLELNGTRDDSSYAFALDDDGTLLWRKTFGGQFTGVFTYPGHFRPKGKQIAAITKNKSSYRAFSESISILNAANGNVISGPRIYGDKIPAIYDFFFTRAVDMNRDGMDEIVIGNSDGYVRVLDNNLDLLHISKNYGKEIQVKAIIDMNGDGFYEVVCIMRFDKLVILDHTLQEMASLPIPNQEGHSVYPVANGQTKRLLLHPGYDFSTGERQIWRLLELQESFVPFEAYTGAAKFFWWSLGGFALFGVLGIALYSRRRFFTRTFVRLLIQAKMFDSALLLTRQGKIRAAGAHWLQMADSPAEMIADRKLSELAKMPAALRSNLLKSIAEKANSEFRLILTHNGRKTPILVQVEYFKLLSLFRATLHFSSQERFVANIKHWAAAAQKLAHGIKNPLTSMKLNIDELAAHLHGEGAEEETMEHVRSISSQINRLHRMSDGFTRFIEFEEPDLAATDVNAFIETTVAQLRDDIPRNISVSLDLSPALPRALINSEQLVYAFENILFNAVQSIEDHGTVIIQTEFVRMQGESTANFKEFVEIRVQDNGAGIDPDFIDKVTDPYFTTKKEGTGLGLNLVVKIMKMHEGEFEIRSQVGEGTIVFLRLKAVS